MAQLQRYFFSFHEVIKLDNFDENETLRSKRDILLRNLKDNLPTGGPRVVRSFNQGSYAMGTGTKPLDGNYDIDVGAVFDVEPDQANSVSLKKVVRDALTHSNRTVEIRRPCVTVNYLKGSVVDYHVDLAIYAQAEGDDLRLAKGKEGSSSENCVWEMSDPEGLCREIANCQEKGKDRAQFRRVIRYLKRWRDYRFSHKGIFSIALTVSAYHWFTPYKDILTEEYNDAGALHRLVEIILSKWRPVVHNGELVHRLQVPLPVEPRGDLLKNLTAPQMDDLQIRLVELRDALKDAIAEPEDAEACKILAKKFGGDFPVPSAEKQNAAKVKSSVVGTGSSA
ncbi:MAG: nucleotidyltransferase [Marinobacter sp.]|uniref:nucleotidyltransferase domain-containing protein n=1 Tax=Marinobacter sp. TaxID=50741 RepID=UPI001B6E6B78|nr:nucleotidyltransferase [Marinobacter sp.]MBQ0746512.1 nucleotidyltransferase [Marinobacter sp.]MBQ0815682.1 nucleotidyltransferase [Marinobacter sp.]